MADRPSGGAVQGVLIADSRVPRCTDASVAGSSAAHAHVHPAWVALLVAVRLPLVPLMFVNIALGFAVWLPLRGAASGLWFVWRLLEVPFYACTATADTFFSSARRFRTDLCVQQRELLRHPDGVRAWVHLRLWACGKDTATAHRDAFQLHLLVSPVGPFWLVAGWLVGPRKPDPLPPVRFGHEDIALAGALALAVALSHIGVWPLQWLFIGFASARWIAAPRSTAFFSRFLFKGAAPRVRCLVGCCGPDAAVALVLLAATSVAWLLLGVASLGGLCVAGGFTMYAVVACSATPVPSSAVSAAIGIQL